MGRVHVQRDKPEDTKKLIVIKYILNQQIKLSSVHTKLSYLQLCGPVQI